MSKIYRCAQCGNLEELTTPAEEMEKEFEKNFAESFDKASANDTMHIVCDDCYQMMMKAKPPKGIVQNN